MVIRDSLDRAVAFLLGGTVALTLVISGCGKKEEAKAPATAPTPAPTAQAPTPQPVAATPSPPPQPPAPTPAAAPSGPKVVQTQTGMTGDVEVDVVKANAQEGILTITLAYRNHGKEEVKLKTIPIDDVYFISEAEKKKYHVLKDSKGDWIGAPVARDKLGTETGSGVEPVSISPGGKTIVWFKFPAPPDSVTTVNLVVPDVMPFDKLPVSR